VFKTFGFAFGVTIAGVVGALILGGPQAAAVVAILAVLEISLSFDNAVVNATILRRMSRTWQTLFLTLGIIIAVFGMRLLFPIVIVALTAHLGPTEVFRLALDDPSQYAARLGDAHPAIAAYGGIFLFMIFLDFLLDTDKDVHWIKPVERRLSLLGEVGALSVVLSLVALLVVAETLAPAQKVAQVLTAGVAGLATYLAVSGLGEFFESRGVGEEDEESEGEGEGAAASGSAPGRAGERLAVGRAAFFLFLYLELIDASFSFDGVVGAFAISQDIFVIATGLGIGAMYIRSLTVYLVRRGTLQEYIYLEHGAHWAIGALAVLLAVTIRYEVPEVVTGLIGVGFIALALLSSIRHRRSVASERHEELVGA